jgi:hypothetical protein
MSAYDYGGNAMQDELWALLLLSSVCFRAECCIAFSGYKKRTSFLKNKFMVYCPS